MRTAIKCNSVSYPFVLSLSKHERVIFRRARKTFISP